MVRILGCWFGYLFIYLDSISLRETRRAKEPEQWGGAEGEVNSSLSRKTLGSRLVTWKVGKEQGWEHE